MFEMSDMFYVQGFRLIVITVQAACQNAILGNHIYCIKMMGFDGEMK